MTGMVRMKFDGDRVPHVVIEVNQQCNISCKACYKDKYGMTKPLAKIKEEVDFSLSQRKLSTITLAGGEPVLHPQLCEVIAYITSKGLTVQMLSNGLALTPEKLQAFKTAGLKKIFLHIDKHQTRPDIPKIVQSEMELNPLRDRIGKMVRDSGITASLQITLYRSALAEVNDFMKYILKSEWCSGLLVTCCTDFDKLASNFKEAKVLNCIYKNPNYGKNDAPSGLENEVFDAQVEVIERFKRDLKMEPFGYVASSEDNDIPRWALYYSFTITDRKGKAESFHLNNSFGNLVKLSSWYRQRIDKAFSFGRYFDRKACIILLGLYGITSLKPLTALKTLRFLAKLLRKGSTIEHKGFTFQLSGPTVTADGRIEYCKDCPDATVRDGKLIPVCMADILSPAKK